jgi:hypothetical protein
MNANHQGEVLSYRIIVMFSTGIKRGQWQQAHSIDEIKWIYIHTEKWVNEKIFICIKLTFS